VTASPYVIGGALGLLNAFAFATAKRGRVRRSVVSLEKRQCVLNQRKSPATDDGPNPRLQRRTIWIVVVH
jgi:hypothetical protein